MGKTNIAVEVRQCGLVSQEGKIALGTSDANPRFALATKLKSLTERQRCLGAAKSLKRAAPGKILNLKAKFGVG